MERISSHCSIDKELSAPCLAARRLLLWRRRFSLWERCHATTLEMMVSLSDSYFARRFSEIVSLFCSLYFLWYALRLSMLRKYDCPCCCFWRSLLSSRHCFMFSLTRFLLFTRHVFADILEHDLQSVRRPNFPYLATANSVINFV